MRRNVVSAGFACAAVLMLVAVTATLGVFPPAAVAAALSFKTASVGRSQVGSDLRPPAASTRNRKLQDGVLMVRRPS